MITMEILLKHCKRQGNDFIFEMSPSFTKFFLGWKFALKHMDYPSTIEVIGNEKMLIFTYVGISANYYIYEHKQWRLLIKFRNNGA